MEAIANALCGDPRRAAAMLACIVGAASGPAVGQQAGAATTQLAPVVVTATRSERALLDVPASVDVIEREDLRDAQLRVNLSETLGRVPGVVVLDRNNYAQDLQISIRGFGSRSTFGVRGVRLYVDGVPATFPDGQGQVSHFPLNAAERIEVLRGPFSALYGNSSGGVIALTTELRPQEPRYELSAAGGSHGTWRAGINAIGGTEPYAYALDLLHFETDGARPHSAARRNAVNLRVGFFDSPLGRVRLSLNALDMPDTEDPQGLTRAQFNSNADQTGAQALLFDTRKNTRQVTLGANIESTLYRNATLTTSAWIGTRSITQFLSIPVGVQANRLQPGGVVDFDRVFGGVDVRASVEFGALTATAGLSVERLDEDRRGFENFVGNQLGVQGALRRDEKNTITAIDPYAQIEWRVAPSWLLHAGVRASRVEFESDDRYIVGINRDDSGSRSFSAVSPTAGVVYRPSERFSLYGSYGRGFETPTLNELAYRPDGSAGFNGALEPARSHNFEIGAKALWTPALRTTLALFAVRTDDDLVVRTNAGGRSSFANVARTRREGVEASLFWRASAALSFSASAAWLDATFDSAFLACEGAPCTVPNVPVAAGNKLPGIPARTFFAEVKWRAAWADLAAEFRAQSPLYVDDRNTDRAPGYGVLNLSAARTFAVGSGGPRLFVRVDNVLDQKYAGSVIVNDGNGRYFEPATGRTFLVGVDWRL